MSSSDASAEEMTQILKSSLTTKEAAQILGCSQQEVRELIHSGDLNAWKYFPEPCIGHFHIFLDSLKELLVLKARAERQDSVFRARCLKTDRHFVELFNFRKSGRNSVQDRSKFGRY